MRRENEYLANSKSLRETKEKLAIEESKKYSDKVASRNAFIESYYANRDKRTRLDGTHAMLMEGARNNALSTIIKSIYITALEAETLTTDGLLLAESMVDNWIKNNGGATNILENAGNKTYLLSRIIKIVEDVAEKEVAEIEGEDDASDEKEEALSKAQEFIDNADKEEIKDFIGQVIDSVQDKAEDEGESKAEDNKESEEKSEKTEDKTEEAPADKEAAEDVEKEVSPEESSKEADDADTEVGKEETPETSEEDNKEDFPEVEEKESADEENKTEKPAPETTEDESKDKEAEEAPAEEEEEIDADTEISLDDKEADDNDTEVPEATPDSEEIDIDIKEEPEDGKSEKEEETEEDDSLDTTLDDDNDDSEESSEETPVKDTEEKDDESEDDDNDDIEDIDVDEEIGDPIEGDDVDITVDGDTENNGKIFNDLKKEDEVRKAIDIIRTRVADAEETFIRNNAEDKKKIDELINKISTNVKTVEDLSEKHKDEAEAAQESARMYKREIDSIRENRILTVFEKMSRLLAINIMKNDATRIKYLQENESSIDVDLVIETSKVMYGFLETINTLQLEKVDAKYIEKVLSGMVE